MPDIMHLLEIQTTAEWLYQALTSAEGIRHWWTRDADLDSWVGGFGEFRFYYEGAAVTRVRIEELHPDRRVVWETVSSFRPEWVGTRIEFDLRPSPTSMVLAFAHRGFEHADDVFAVTTTSLGLLPHQPAAIPRDRTRCAQSGHRLRPRHPERAEPSRVQVTVLSPLCHGPGSDRGR